VFKSCFFLFIHDQLLTSFSTMHGITVNMFATVSVFSTVNSLLRLCLMMLGAIWVFSDSLLCKNARVNSKPCVVAGWGGGVMCNTWIALST